MYDTVDGPAKSDKPPIDGWNAINSLGSLPSINRMFSVHSMKVLWGLKWVCLKIGYIPNEIAIFHRDNDH